MINLTVSSDKKQGLQDLYIFENGSLQPKTHYYQKKISEKLSCFQNYDLTQSEVQKLQDLQLEYEIQFDKENPRHIQFLQELYYLAFNNQIDQQNISNENWKIIGFQGLNPSTDFRGGGLQSLRDLIYLFQNSSPKLIQLFKDNNQNFDFLLSIISINLTFFLKNYYHLSQSLIYEKDKDKICSRICLKNFCVVLKKDFQITQKILSLLIKVMLNKWIRFRSQNTSASLMDLETVKKNLIQTFINFTKNYFFSDFEQLQFLFIKYMDIIKFIQKQDYFFEID